MMPLNCRGDIDLHKLDDAARVRTAIADAEEVSCGAEYICAPATLRLSEPAHFLLALEFAFASSNALIFSL